MTGGEVIIVLFIGVIIGVALAKGNHL